MRKHMLKMDSSTESTVVCDSLCIESRYAYGTLILLHTHASSYILIQWGMSGPVRIQEQSTEQNSDE